MKLNALLYVTSIVLLAGCNSLRQEVTPSDLVQGAEQLTVACFISPQDTILAARITNSFPVLGIRNENNPDVPDATVTLSDGSQSVTLQPTRITDIYSSTGGYLLYRAKASQLPIAANKTYTLTASTPDGRKITASCTVPARVPLDQVILDSAVTNEFGDLRKSYFARLLWHDPAGQVNYYRVAGNNEYATRIFISTSPNTPPRDTLIRYRGDWDFNASTNLTDVNLDGQLMVSARGRLAPYSYTLENGVWVPTRPSGQLDAYLLHVDENYYRYHDAIERQNLVRDNPFAEPVLIPSNIQGGLGCFGAYNRSTITMTVK